MSWSIFEGPDRLEFSPRLGRPVRQGAFANLVLSDFERVEGLLSTDPEGARESVVYLHMGNLMMADIGFEFVLGWLVFLCRRQGEAAAREVLAEAFREWVPPSEGQALWHNLRAALDDIGEDALERHQASKQAEEPTRAARFKGPLLAVYQRVQDRLEVEDWRTYFAEARSLHDRLFELNWQLGEVVLRRFGQAVAEEGLSEALTGCSFYEPAWAQGLGLSQAEMAVVLAEHLRGHFSGAGRQGSVRLVEEPDRYRLVLEPCGSGGAIRRSLRARGESVTTMPQASGLTWGRDDVPSYCAHCALNELQSVKRLGFPRWVTEFDPDPSRPCGWTLYKDPNAIPEEYFRRLGVERDPSRFVQLPTAPGS